MSEIEIKHPTENNRNENRKALPTQFIAAGTAWSNGSEIVGVLGKLDATFDEAGGIPGITVVWTVRGADQSRHWAILFGTPTSPVTGGDHNLYVRGFRADGTYYDAGPILFEVKHEVIGITYPASNVNIYDERDYFVAYGSLTHDAVSAIMADPDDETNDRRAKSLFSYVDLEFWSAVFPPLAAGVKHYTLHVVDSASHTAVPVQHLSTTP